MKGKSLSRFVAECIVGLSLGFGLYYGYEEFYWIYSPWGPHHNMRDCVIPLKESLKYRCVYRSIA